MYLQELLMILIMCSVVDTSRELHLKAQDKDVELPELIEKATSFKESSEGSASC